MRLWPFRLEKKSQTDEQILELLGGSVATSAGVSVSSESALRVPAVAAAVRTISEAVASLDCRVVEIQSDGTERAKPDHEVNALISTEANEWSTAFEMIRQLTVDALTRDQGGLAWVNWLRDKPVEIIRYRPGIISPEADPDGTGRFTYRINGRSTPAQQIVHIHSTFDKCPVTLCREAIGVALVMERYAGRLFGNGARPGGLLKTKKSPGDTGVMKILKGWKAAHEGPDASGNTAILWDDMDWQQMTLSSVDAQFQQLRLFQLQEICRAFNIPASMLGDLSRATWSNSAEMRLHFLQLCLEPWLKAVESGLTRALFKPEDRKTLAIKFDRDDFSNVDLAVRATAINSLVAARVLNPNEGRSWLGGLAPYDGGNEFANPNTGASQPGAKPGGAAAPRPNDEDENDAD